ncbi:hypothetical protein U5922_015175 [Aquicoccus sp. G2-2]|uniref:hypothetical protein n=1 Tax=Aquicoccus sp. G2-2 TaxID=3092120 RepID=UPI002AE045FD|nr:hypothetical protein [Aquicoccus sp. G2-2]MEA1114734.1 hypothetical protein [Aquicoccus sp. G2-2]
MFGVGIAAYLGLAGLCIVSAIATLSFFSLFDRTGCKHTRSANTVGADDVVRYLFDGESIVTATDPATRILDMTSPNAGAVWPTLERAFRLRFSNIPATAEAARNLAPIELPAQDTNDPAKLAIRLCRDALIVTLEDLTTPSIADIHIQRSFARLNNQIDASARLHPDPIWMQSANGEVQWSNNAYQRLIQTCGTGEGAPQCPASICHLQRTPQLAPKE